MTCEIRCELIVVGNNKDLEIFQSTASMKLHGSSTSECGFQIEAFLPKPDGHDCQDDSKWNIENWGVRYICEDESYLRKSELNKLHYHIVSVPSAPCEGIKNISLLYPELLFKLEYVDPIIAYSGHSYFKNGLEIEFFLCIREVDFR